MFRATCVLLALFAAVCAAQRCGLRCYSDTVEWDDQTSLQFAFSVIPCAPVVVVVVVQATLTDDETVLPEFGCVAAEHIVSVTLDHGDTHLEWRYETESSCEQVLGSLDTIPGVFLGTNHRQGATHTQYDGAPLEASQRLCERECDICVDSTSIKATGHAGSKSPCGPEGVVGCELRVQWHANTCTGQLTSLDVFLGSDAIPLSVFQPDALLGAQMRCDDGIITIESQGVLLEWHAPDRHNADCTSIVGLVQPLANGLLKQVMVQLGDDEMWSSSKGSSLAATKTLCDTMNAPMPSVRPEPAAETEPTAPVVHSNSVVPVGLPVDVFVHCSRRSNRTNCCTVYGYRNPNPSVVSAPTEAPYNYFVPNPATRTQPGAFLANTTVETAFSVLWDCPEYERHKLRWVLQLPAENRTTWRRIADGVRERNDCSDQEYVEWCIRPQT